LRLLYLPSYRAIFSSKEGEDSPLEAAEAMEAERREAGMSVQEIKTSYSAVAHLDSFWDAVCNFIALKEAEGKQVASALMTHCVATGVALSNVSTEDEVILLTSALQEKAFHSLWAYLEDPALTPEARDVSLEAVWETAKV
jgi:hypothetical protein